MKHLRIFFNFYIYSRININVNLEPPDSKKQNPGFTLGFATTTMTSE